MNLQKIVIGMASKALSNAEPLAINDVIDSVGIIHGLTGAVIDGDENAFYRYRDALPLDDELKDMIGRVLWPVLRHMADSQPAEIE